MVALPRGLWLYVDVSRKGRRDVHQLEEVTSQCRVDGLALYGPSQSRSGPNDLDRPDPTRYEMQTAEWAHKLGLDLAIWYWPVPDRHGREDDNPIIPSALEWARLLEAKHLIADMESAWFGLPREAGGFVDAATAAAHGAGLSSIVSTYRHWRPDKVPMAQFARADAIQLQVYTNRPADCAFEKRDGTRFRGSQDFDSYPAEAVDWASEYGVPVLPAPRAYEAGGWSGKGKRPRVVKVDGPKWDADRFGRHLRAMPDAPATFVWKLQSLWAHRRFWPVLAAWKAQRERGRRVA